MKNDPKKTYELQKITINNLNLSYFIKDNGFKQTILLIHGFDSSSDFASSLYELENNYNIIAFNLPGSKLLEDQDSQYIDLNVFVNTLNEFINSHIKKHQQIILVGHSLAGGVVSKLNENEKVIGTVFISTINPYMTKGQKWMLLNEYYNSQTIKSKIKNFFIDKAKDLYVKYLDPNNPIKEFLDVNGKFSNIIKNYLLNVDYMENTLKDQYFNSLNKKTVFIIGDSDNVVETKYFIEFVENVLKQKVYLIEDAKHNPFNTHAKEINQIINDNFKFKKRFFWWWRKIIKNKK